jgi:hypothetical protein
MGTIPVRAREVLDGTRQKGEKGERLVMARRNPAMTRTNEGGVTTDGPEQPSEGIIKRRSEQPNITGAARGGSASERREPGER